MKILITGASGLIGSALAPLLSSQGHTVTRAVRRAPTSDSDVEWDPAAGTIDADRLVGTDAVVHLAGESIASGRWNEERKARMLASRVQGTQLISRAIAGLGTPPRVLVSASAIGYYGDRGDEVLDEKSPSGSGFLAEICREWERATEEAEKAGIRVVHVRIGVVLSKDGGALATMLPAFKTGLGGSVSDGHQYMSWITLDDVIRIILHAIERDSIHGAVNAVAPNPVTNAEFTSTLGKVLSRPTIFSVPAFALRVALGSEMAEELMLSSMRVAPARLKESGFSFDDPELEGALHHVLEK